ncbi:TetR/AcrR family transcriptional regulator [Microbacterium sp. HD4P20]|uniref:TetR/AcrR family transcriptional regulator n=1 Tax=Microbacterium sp. HD4P20 TaxID=2864874 RepID=UPI001C63C01A|nr:TetR/AcrR family transcriptional regulator [Microbacterium sp. HD4P20]MCP2636087.1 TetR/AcrR family transcriptional regulator [Microbacterium sp. HD4P20]
MARPSVAEERVGQIVEATIRTIAAEGITGASLGRIAEEAGMSRGHVRHFVGNREELLRESARRFYYEGTEGESILPAGTADVAGAVDFFFSEEFAAPGNDNVVVLGFVEAARSDPALADLLVSAYQGTHVLLARLLAAEHPGAEPEDCDSVAYGVVGIALHNVFLSDIASAATGTETARTAAERLIATLPS